MYQQLECILDQQDTLLIQVRTVVDIHSVALKKSYSSLFRRKSVIKFCIKLLLAIFWSADRFKSK